MQNPEATGVGRLALVFSMRSMQGFSRLARRLVVDTAALRAPVAAIAMVATAAVMLGIWAWQSSTQRYDASIALLRSNADFAAQRFSSRVEGDFYIGSLTLFRRLSSASRGFVRSADG